ncbi:MAG: AFG1/ZapE family ATPase, partial [Gammaproteobacteria bacterium]
MALTENYLKAVSSQEISRDDAQLKLAERLDTSLQEINKKKSILQFFSKPKPQRIYIHGDVGRGKTFLMDMLYEEIKHEKKIRLHFHRFMQNLHENLKQHEGGTDPLKKIVSDLSKKYECLCFDEFYVED